MPKIVLARHGQSTLNAEDRLCGRLNPSLTDLGREQAADLARVVAEYPGVNVRYIMHSPLDRAVETAQVCGIELDINVMFVINSALERSHGILEGEPYRRIPYVATEWREAHNATYVIEVEGGESYAQLCERAQIVWQEIKSMIEAYCITDGDILFIGHGALNRALLAAHLYGHEPNVDSHMLDEPSLENCKFYIIEI